MCDFTDADAIKVGKMIADGLLWRDVVDKLYPDTEYPELMMELTYERFCHWCKQHTPESLIEAFRPSDECDDEWHMAVGACLYFKKRSAIRALNRRGVDG